MDKRRRRTKSVRDYFYTVPDTQRNCVDIQDVEQSSGASLQITTSSQPGSTTFKIHGTRGEIYEALRLITSSAGFKEVELDKAKKHWLEWVQQSFPDFESRSYFIPPVQIMRVPIAEENVAGQNILMIKTVDTSSSSTLESVMSSSKIPCVQKSDIIDDEALHSVRLTLTQFSAAQPEVFMCLSQYSYGSYLGEECFYPAVAHLPLPSNLPKTYPRSWRQGDFDVLLIHRQYGFVVFEVKAVKINDETTELEQTEQVSKKLKEAAEQLQKAEAMLSHLVSDLASGMRITKTIACPNLTTHQVQKIVNDNSQLGKDLCECLKAKNCAEVARLILCSDHLLSHETQQTLRNNKLQAFQNWWKEMFAVQGADKQLDPELYKNITARFCGPASSPATARCVNEPSVCIKTLDNAVAHVGHCYADLKTLLPEQIKLLQRAPRRVFLAGPPGTGRSTMLLRIAIKWFLDGNKVYVLSTWDYSLAATYRLRHLLHEALNKHSDRENRIVLMKKDFRQKEDVDTTLNELADVAKHEPLYIIADEVGPDYKSEQNVFPDFCARLLKCCPGVNDCLHLWATSCETGLAPHELYDEKLKGWKLEQYSCLLRCPPPVIREIKVEKILNDQSISQYDRRNVIDHADGQPVERLYHSAQEHKEAKVEDCVACAEKVERFLCTQLKLGVSAASSTDESTASVRHSPSLQYKDVFILSWMELPEGAPILKVLPEAGIPVQVMKKLDSDIEDVATDRSNVVWAARQQLVRGINRKVVVVLDNHDDSNLEYKEARRRVMSRCTAQLVLVCPIREKSD